jgi:hypothetical protein
MMAVALLPLALGGCASVTEPSEPVICTLVAVSSLNVTVRDAVTSPRICDATVVSIQSGTPYELRRSGTAAACTYSGPEERPGAFEVRVSRAGYLDAAARTQVSADQCHVIPMQVTIDLQPRS